MKYIGNCNSKVRAASTGPGVEYGDIVFWTDNGGGQHTGQIKSVEKIEQTWWAAAHYEQCPESLPCTFILENRHASGFTKGTDPTFPVTFGQKVWFLHGGLWQAAYVKALYIVCDRWLADLGFTQWYGLDFASVPLGAIRTSAPELAEDREYTVWLDTLISA